MRYISGSVTISIFFCMKMNNDETGRRKEKSGEEERG